MAEDRALLLSHRRCRLPFARCGAGDRQAWGRSVGSNLGSRNTARALRPAQCRV